MEKAALHALAFRKGFGMDPVDRSAPIADFYADFTPWWLRQVSGPFHRPVGPPPSISTKLTTSRIDGTIDGSVLDRSRANSNYRPPELKAWAGRLGIDPTQVRGTVQPVGGKPVADASPAAGTLFA